MSTESVTSTDGTRIRLGIAGAGDPLVLVPGGGADSSYWLPALPRLASHFACYSIDRRGWGGSGDSAHYAISREYEDVSSVLEWIGSPAFLLGHSYGAICAAGAACVSPVAKLVLYEPPLPVEGPVVGVAKMAAIHTAIDAGDYRKAARIGALEVVKMPREEAAFLDAMSDDEVTAFASTWTRELAEIDGLGPDVGHYRAITADTLLLLGTETPRHHLAATEALATVLPSATICRLEGQGHEGAVTAPDLFADTVISFLT